MTALRKDLRNTIAASLRSGLSLTWNGDPLTPLVTEGRDEPLDARQHKVTLDVSIFDDSNELDGGPLELARDVKLSVRVMYRHPAADTGATPDLDSKVAADRLDDLIYAIERIVVNSDGIGRRATSANLKKITGYKQGKYQIGFKSDGGEGLIGLADMEFPFRISETVDATGGNGDDLSKIVWTDIDTTTTRTVTAEVSP